MSRLTHLCLAQSFSTLGTRFRALRQNCRRLHPPRHDPDHAEAACGKPLVMNPNFVDGLLELTGLADENFIEAAAKWTSSKQARAAQRSSEFSKQLDDV